MRDFLENIESVDVDSIDELVELFFMSSVKVTLNDDVVVVD